MVKCTLADSIFRVAVNTHQRITWSPLLFLSSSCVSSVRGSQNYLHIAVFAKFWHWKSLAQILSALTPLDRLTAAAVLPFWPISCLRSFFHLDSFVDKQKSRVHCTAVSNEKVKLAIERIITKQHIGRHLVVVVVTLTE